MPDACTPRGHTLGSALTYSLATNGASLRLSHHFTLIEMASKDGADKVLAHPALIHAVLEPLRAHFGAPVHINSGYRSPAHNRRIGGASKSRHLYGLAADVVVRGVSPDDVADYLATLNPGGLGRYQSFTHVDVQGVNRRWDQR